MPGVAPHNLRHTFREAPAGPLAGNSSKSNYCDVRQKSGWGSFTPFRPDGRRIDPLGRIAVACIWILGVWLSARDACPLGRPNYRGSLLRFHLVFHWGKSQSPSMNMHAATETVVTGKKRKARGRSDEEMRNSTANEGRSASATLNTPPMDGNKE